MHIDTSDVKIRRYIWTIFEDVKETSEKPNFVFSCCLVEFFLFFCTIANLTAIDRFVVLIEV